MLQEYYSLVGKQHFYVVKVGPDCANAARNLECHMSNPGMLHYGRQWDDASYAKKQLSGMIGAVEGMLISWSSCTIKKTTPSSIAAEYVTFGEGGQELNFVCMLSEEIGIDKFQILSMWVIKALCF